MKEKTAGCQRQVGDSVEEPSGLLGTPQRAIHHPSNRRMLPGIHNQMECRYQQRDVPVVPTSLKTITRSALMDWLWRSAVTGRRASGELQTTIVLVSLTSDVGTSTGK